MNLRLLHRVLYKPSDSNVSWEVAECLRELTGFILVVLPSNKTRFPLSDWSDFPAFKLGCEYDLRGRWRPCEDGVCDHVSYKEK